MARAVPRQRPAGLHGAFERRDHAIDGVGSRLVFRLAFGQSLGNPREADELLADFLNWRGEGAANAHRMGGRAKKSSLHGVGRRPSDMAGGGGPWWGLRGQLEVELPDQELLVGVEFGMAAEHERAAVGGGEVNVEHLHGGELVQDGPRREAVRQRLEHRAQGDVETIGEESDEDVRFAALDQLMVDRTQLQIVLEGLERGLDPGELDIDWI